MSDDSSALLSIVCHYAAYLKTRANATPEISMNGNRAEVCLTLGAKTLVALFGGRKKKWSLCSIEVHRGDETDTSGCGELARAVAILLGAHAAVTPPAGGQASPPGREPTRRSADAVPP